MKFNNAYNLCVIDLNKYSIKILSKLASKYNIPSLNKKQICEILAFELLKPFFIKIGHFNPFYNIDMCKLGDPNLIINKVNSAGASKSILIFGNVVDINVVIKLSFKSLYESIDNSLFIERYIYKDLVPKMRIHTPHLSAFIAEYTCSDFLIKMHNLSINTNNLYATKILSLIKRLDTDTIKRYDWSEAYFSITKLAKGDSLDIWLNKIKHQNALPEAQQTFYLTILLQIAYTLIVFEKVGLMHNDLHSGNILIEELPTETYFTYSIPIDKSLMLKDHKMNIINEKDTFAIYQIKSKYNITIIDFDRASKVNTCFSNIIYNNTILDSDLCPKIGQCNKFIHNRDWFNILNIMYGYKLAILNKILDTIISEQLQIPITVDVKSGNSLKGLLAYYGQGCICDNNTCSTCTNIIFNDNLIKSPTYFITKNYKQIKETTEYIYSIPF